MTLDPRPNMIMKLIKSVAALRELKEEGGVEGSMSFLPWLSTHVFIEQMIQSRSPFLINGEKMD